MIAKTEYDGTIKKGATTYRYNAAGAVIEVSMSSEKDGNYATFKKTIGSDGRVAEASDYSGQTLIRRTTYAYANAGNRIIETFDAAKGQKYTVTKEYDASKNTIAVTFTMPDGKVVQSDTYQYNDSGIVIDEKHVEAAKLKSHSTRDANGNTRTIQNDRIYETVYNRKGDVSEENMYSADGKPWTQALYEYVYDSKGNWIKRIDRENGSGTFVTVREIEYAAGADSRLTDRQVRPPSAARVVIGVVIAVNLTAWTLRMATDGGDVETVTVPEGTPVFYSGKQYRIRNLERGDRVQVSLSGDKAVRVDVLQNVNSR